MTGIPSILKTINQKDIEGNYIGVKNTDVISLQNLIDKLPESYILHTIDKASYKGRAIDLDLINPITGRFMTGSSSGTALNVFLGINDIGIGTDGGGSILAPALSLNLFGFISPLLDHYLNDSPLKKSTDGIEFSPSLGIITRNYELMKETIQYLINLKNVSSKKILFAYSKYGVHQPLLKFAADDFIELNYNSLNRREMIEELRKINFEKYILVTCEGPIDLLGYGDSVLGHYDDISKSIQALGHKYYLKVINMLKLSAFIVPSSYLSRGYLIITKSDSESINQAIKLLSEYEHKVSELEESYFRK